MRLRLGGLGGLVAVVVGCSTPPAATPDATYRVFAEALRGREPKAAWELLSTSTKTAAAARSKAVAAASGGLVKDEPMLLVLQSGVLPGPIGDITVVDQTPTSATLEVGPAERRSRVALVREASGEAAGWRVDLSTAFGERTP